MIETELAFLAKIREILVDIVDRDASRTHEQLPQHVRITVGLLCEDLVDRLHETRVDARERGRRLWDEKRGEDLVSPATEFFRSRDDVLLVDVRDQVEELQTRLSVER